MLKWTKMVRRQYTRAELAFHTVRRACHVDSKRQCLLHGQYELEILVICTVRQMWIVD